MLILVPGGSDESGAALLLHFCKGRSDFLEDSEVLVDIRFGMLNADSPLLVPPIGLGEHAPIDHAEPVEAPEIDVNLGPIAVVLNLLGIEHQRAVDTRAGNVGLQAGSLDNGAIAFRKSFAEFADVRIIFSR